MTKIIVECNKCKHQYKIHNKRVGEKFPCFCGNLLAVPAVKIHDAAVVRCSSCGGARGKDLEPYCRYCGSSFTLHERDLNTICPHCMTRISSKAKFCHSCSTPIVADSEGFVKTDMPCPSCDGIHLHSRQLQGQSFSVKECDECAGLWLSADVFRHLEKMAQKESASGVQSKPQNPKSSYHNETINPTKFYKRCPQCQVVMHRKNYANSSGIVIDVCSKHGLWFDIHELDEILNFVRSGLLLKHQERAARIAKQKRKRAKTSAVPISKSSANTVYDITSARGDVFADVISWLLD